MIMRRRYHIIERTATSKKEMDNALARSSFPQFPYPPFASCYPHCAKSIIHGSPRYDTQQILQAAVLATM